MADRAQFAAAMTASRQHKMRDTFEGRRYRILRKFDLDEDQYIRSVFGYRLRRGYLLQEIEDPDNTIAVGYVVMRAAADEFGAVYFPRRKPGRPPRAESGPESRISALLTA